MSRFIFDGLSPGIPSPNYCHCPTPVWDGEPIVPIRIIYDCFSMLSNEDKNRFSLYLESSVFFDQYENPPILNFDQCGLELSFSFFLKRIAKVSFNKQSIDLTIEVKTVDCPKLSKLLNHIDSIFNNE